MDVRHIANSILFEKWHQKKTMKKNIHGVLYTIGAKSNGLLSEGKSKWFSSHVIDINRMRQND